MSKKESEKLVKKVEEMSMKEQYANIYIEAELHTSVDEMIRNTEIALAKKEGKEAGIKEGIEQGLEEGKREGIEEGSNNEKIEIAKNMLNKNINIELISEVTGLSKEEIESLK